MNKSRRLPIWLIALLMACGALLVGYAVWAEVTDFSITEDRERRIEDFSRDNPLIMLLLMAGVVVVVGAIIISVVRAANRRD